VRQYADGTKHMVVVDPKGEVEDQRPFEGDLITQFPYAGEGYQESLIIDWERMEGEGRLQEGPNPTRVASSVPGPQRPGQADETGSITQKEDTTSEEKVKLKEEYAITARKPVDSSKFQPSKSNPLQESEDQPGLLQRTWDEFLYQAQDRFRYLNKAQMEVARRNRVELPEEQDAYLAETRYHGMAAAAIDDFEERYVDPLMETIDKAGLSIESVDEYLHARHAQEANARLRRINPSQKDIDALIRTARADLEAVKAERAAIRKENPDDYPKNKRYRKTEKEMSDLHAEIDRLENFTPVKDNTALSGMTDQEAVRILTAARTGSKARSYQQIGEMVDAITKAQRDLRFIPTLVGNTISFRRFWRIATVHPHARGEH